MKIGITCDHHGVNLKEYLTKKLLEMGYTVVDYGPNSKEKVDYPEYALKLGNALMQKKIDYGIAICGTGIGMSIMLNKMKGVYCARVSTLEEALLSRLHNDANCLSFSANLSKEDAFLLVEKFINTPFSEEERHQKRIQMIKDYEEKC